MVPVAVGAAVADVPRLLQRTPGEDQATHCQDRAQPGQRQFRADGHRQGRGQFGAGSGGVEVVPGVAEQQYRSQRGCPAVGVAASTQQHGGGDQRGGLGGIEDRPPQAARQGGEQDQPRHQQHTAGEEQPLYGLPAGHACHLSPAPRPRYRLHRSHLSHLQLVLRVPDVARRGFISGVCAAARPLRWRAPPVRGRTGPRPTPARTRLPARPPGPGDGPASGARRRT